jgi:hypothetical protein
MVRVCPALFHINLTSILLGDKYFVCWDPDLVPTVIAQVIFFLVVLFTSLHTSTLSLMTIHPTKNT